MTAFTIRARFPLGVYQGHSPDGVTVDDFPSTARLFSSLVHAAAKGSTAEPRREDLRMTASSEEALTWVENNPPTVWKPTGRVERFGHNVEISSYRPEAVLDKNAPKKSRKRISQGVAVEAGWAWSWIEMPDDVATALESICPDVASLGERESVAVLDTSREAVEGLRLSSGGQLDGRGIRVETPAPGRLAELESAHTKLLEAKSPSTAEDRHKASEDLQKPPVPRGRVINSYYTMFAKPDPDLPWTRAVLLPIERRLHDDELVTWTVALHLSLIHI